MSTKQLDSEIRTPQGLATAGLVLARLVVPLWVLMGASAKLIEQSPSSLPKNLREAIEGVGVNLHAALSIFIIIEFVAVALMVLVPRLARTTAIFMLASFCLVLIWEIVNGNVESCGCLGSNSPSPVLMLSIDSVLLIGVSVLPVRRHLEPDASIGWPLVSLVAVAIATVSLLRMPPAAITVQVPDGNADTTPRSDPDAPPPPEDDTANQTNRHTPLQQLTLPAYYQPDVEDWAGQPIDAIDLVQWTAGLPADLNTGRHYLIYFSHTCEHCYELLLMHFDFDLPAPTTLVAIPETTDGFAEDGLLENPCIDCGTVLQLPVGVDWLITPPIVIAIEDGIVQCAQEAEDVFDPQCLPWHGL